MNNAQQRNIKGQISNDRHIIGHGAIGEGVLAAKIKHRVTRLNKAIHKH